MLKISLKYVRCLVSGPFANIAHGNSSIIADRIALKLVVLIYFDYVVFYSLSYHLFVFLLKSRPVVILFHLSMTFNT